MGFFSFLTYWGVPKRPPAVPLSSTDTWDEVLNYASGGLYASMNFANNSKGFSSQWVAVGKKYGDVFKEASVVIGHGGTDYDRDIQYFVNKLHGCDVEAHSVREQERATQPQLPAVSSEEAPPVVESSPGLSTILYTNVAGIPLWAALATVGGAIVVKKYVMKRK